MLETFTPLQIAAYGSMGLVSVVSLHRVMAALDCLVLLAREGRPARRLHRALEHGAESGTGQVPDPMRLTLEDLARRGHTRTARFFAQITRRSGPADLRAARERFVTELDAAIAPHLHRLARLSAIVGPMGLGFTVLALMIYLVDRDAGDTTGMSGGLLEALPVSLGTTAIACFNLVALKWSASLLVQRADQTVTAVLAASDAWLAGHASRTPDR